jgi:hypothetical protein
MLATDQFRSLSKMEDQNFHMMIKEESLNCSFIIWGMRFQINTIGHLEGLLAEQTIGDSIKGVVNQLTI